MSIFKDSLKPYVQNQLTARQTVVSQQGTPTGKVGSIIRDDKFLRYVSGKNAWVKMSSFVDIVNLDKSGKNNLGLKIGNTTYKGDQLARKYILEGGTLYEEKIRNEDGNLVGTNKFTLRSGVGKRSSAYASDIDLGGNRPLGYRPMPGITSIQINNKSAYGSLREATVKFYAWDKHQLEELELLYMRTGYSVLLEWGWSQYLDSDNLDNITINNFDTPTIDIFYDGDILSPPENLTSDEVIYRKIETLNEKTNGNYDAMLGYVKNFSWQLMDNGGFECTTVLISRGEVISTLKLSSNGPSFSNSALSSDTPPLSLFESIMLNYSAVINESEITELNVGQFASTSSASPVTNVTVEQFKEDFKNRLKVPLYAISGSTIALYNETIKSTLYPSDSSTNEFGKILLTKGNVDGVGIEYIKMDYFIALINLYFNFKDINNKTIAQILIPNDTPCLASKNSVSIDPSTCIIYNSKATFITGLPEGALPKTLTQNTSTNITYDHENSVSNEQFLNDINLGKIGNIYLSIPKLIEIYRSKTGGSTDVSVISFLKDLLDNVSRALGGINDFQLHTTKSAIQIIDVKYLEQGASSSKYMFDLLGLKSICRDVKITSRVFESQSTMMAIAAQSRANIGDLYSSTQNYLNKGLTDRIIPEKVIWNEGSYLDRLTKTFSNLISLQGYISSKCIGVSTNGVIGEITYPSSEEISNSATLLKTFLLQLNGKDVNFKAIIPFELEITLDGIAGLVQGQIFKINSNILPDTYSLASYDENGKLISSNNLGFIITGLSHSLQNNDWVTNVKTQVCVLDNESIIQDLVDIDSLKQELTKLVEKRETNILIWSVLADYMVQTSLEVFNYTLAYINKTSLADITGDETLFGWEISKKTPKQSELTWRDVTDALAEAGARYFNENDKDHYFLAYNTYGRRGGDTQKLGEINSTKFGNIFEPDLAKYYTDVWRPVAIQKAELENNATLLTTLNNLKTFDNVRAYAEIIENGEPKRIEVQFNYNLIDDFLSYPVRFSSTPNTWLKDSFVFRSPDYVKFTKTSGKVIQAGSVFTPTFYNFRENSLDALFTKADDNTYYYKIPQNSQELFKLWYSYIYNSGFFSGVDAQFQPSIADLNAGRIFSIY